MIDVRQEIPVWVKYVINTRGGHDKFIEVRVDLDDDGTFLLTKRWGRRPDDGGGQVKQESYYSMYQVTRIADTYLSGKIKNGYEVTERPTLADSRIRKDYPA